MRYLLVLIAICNLCACSNSGPGYSARINIGNDAGATENNIILIKNVLKGKNTEVIFQKSGTNWKVESYKIHMNGKRFDAVERKYIIFVTEYYYSGNSKALNDTLEKIEVRIGNSWEGRKQNLKLEIDRITDQVISSLMKRFDESNISVNRKYVSPM